MGIAVGNTHAISPLFIFFAIQFLFLLGKLGICKKKKIPENRKFTHREKSDILDMLSEIVLLKLTKNLKEKKVNSTNNPSHFVSASDDISYEIANMMREEIKNHPKYIQRGSRIFQDEIIVELVENSIRKQLGLTENSLIKQDNV